MSRASQIANRTATLMLEAPFLYEVTDNLVENDPINYPLAIGSLVLSGVSFAFESRRIKRDAVQQPVETNVSL